MGGVLELVRGVVVPEAELLEVYNSVGWTAYTKDPASLVAAWEGSSWTCAARVDGELVGLCRAVTDGVSIVYLQDVLVRPAAHRQGIGRALVQACLDDHAEVRQFVLLTDDRPEQLAFYRSLGLARIADLRTHRLNAFVRFAGITLS